MGGLIGEPLIWVFVIAGAVASAQASLLYPVIIVAGFLCVAAVGEFITSYRCDNCHATFTFHDLRGK